MLVISIPIALIFLLLAGSLIWYLIDSPKGELVLWDGFFILEGKCYEWVDAPAGATSKIYINKVVPENRETNLENMLTNIIGDMNMEPIQDVEIHVGGKKSIENFGDKYLQLKANTDVIGEVYPQGLDAHFILAILVRDNN